MRPKITTTEASAAMHTQFDREQAKTRDVTPHNNNCLQCFPSRCPTHTKNGLLFLGRVTKKGYMMT